MKSRKSYRGAFTLVELLVVVSIIALLLGILLPALGKAREAAKSVNCQTNMKAIGQSLFIYSEENVGVIVPAEVHGSAGWEDAWGTLLINADLLDAPKTGTIDDFQDGKHLLRCPSGVSESNEFASPDDPWDRYGAMATPQKSLDEASEEYWIGVWYGANGDHRKNGYNDDLPFYRVDVDGKSSPPWSKMTKVTAPSRGFAFYDGWYYHNSGGSWPRLEFHEGQFNARHNGGRSTNMLFLDTHTEKMDAKALQNVESDDERLRVFE